MTNERISDAAVRQISTHFQALVDYAAGAVPGAFPGAVTLAVDDELALDGRPETGRGQAACELHEEDGSVTIYVARKLLTGRPASGPRGVLSGQDLVQRQVGVLAHELAHAHLLMHGVEHTEREADHAAERLFDYVIRYDEDDVQTVDSFDPRTRAERPAHLDEPARRNPRLRGSQHPNPKASENGRFAYVMSCPSSTYEDIQALQESEHDVSRQTFAKAIGPERWKQIQEDLGYDRDFPISKDWHVGYYKGVFRGVPAYFVRHSRIEHIFTLDGKVGPSLAPHKNPGDVFDLSGRLKQRAEAERARKRERVEATFQSTMSTMAEDPGFQQAVRRSAAERKMAEHAAGPQRFVRGEWVTYVGEDGAVPADWRGKVTDHEWHEYDADRPEHHYIVRWRTPAGVTHEGLYHQDDLTPWAERGRRAPSRRSGKAGERQNPGDITRWEVVPPWGETDATTESVDEPAPRKMTAKMRALAEKAVEAARLYHGSARNSPFRDQVKLEKQMWRAYARLAKATGNTLENIAEQIGAEAQRRGPITPIPGRHV